MVYECEKCNSPLPAGVMACSKCGERFDEAVPQDAEVPARGWQPKSDVTQSSIKASKSEIDKPAIPRTVILEDDSQTAPPISVSSPAFNSTLGSSASFQNPALPASKLTAGKMLGIIILAMILWPLTILCIVVYAIGYIRKHPEWFAQAKIFLTERNNHIRILKIIRWLAVGLSVIGLLIFGPQGNALASVFFALPAFVAIWTSRDWQKRSKLLSSAALGLILCGCVVYSLTPKGRAAYATELHDAAVYEQQKVVAQKQEAERAAVEQANQAKVQAAEDAQQAAQQAEQDKARASQDAQQAADGQPLTDIGAVGHLQIPGADATDPAIHVGASEQGLNDLMNTSLKKDDVGFQQVFDRGEAFTVPAGTQAKLLDFHGLLGSVAQVRIIGGTHDTEEAWVPKEWVRKN